VVAQNALKVEDLEASGEAQAGAAGLLGGAALLKRRIRTRLDVHEVLERGIPSSAFNHLLARVKRLDPAAVRKAVGLSVRTVQRRNQTPQKPLSPEQSGRAWKFAEVLAKATEVLGSQDAAEEWLNAPALGLDQHRPIELLSTAVGAEMVERLLVRIEYGVYT
jgi:putative toxin-antitoxin system antitoxin component (TIGR02293 family)